MATLYGGVSGIGRNAIASAFKATGSGMSNVAKGAWHHKSTIGLFSVGTAALGLTMINAGIRTSRSFRRGILPNTAYPVSSGQFGYRTARDAGPAGIAGLKFQFRRR